MRIIRRIQVYILNNKNLSIACLTTLLIGCGNDGDDQQTVPPKSTELVILHINDHHSHLDQESMELSVDLGQGNQSFEVDRGGFSRVAEFINEKAKNKTNIFKMHAGDAITGDLFYNLTQGRADADAMNTVCFDSMTLGNHEFDSKDQGLKTFIDYLDSSLTNNKCERRTEILSANVVFGKSSPLYQTDRVKKTHIFEREGEKYGVIGLTIADKTKNSSQPNEDTLFSEEIKTAQKEIDQLKTQGINKIILQTHVGYGLDQKLAQQLTDVDVIIGGDSHSLLGPESLKKYGLSPEGAYPTQLRNKDGDLVCIAQAWQYSYVVGELKIKFNQNGKVESCQGTPHVLIGDNFKLKGQQVEVDLNTKNNILRKLNEDQFPFNVVKKSEITEEVLTPYRKLKETFTQEKIAITTEALCLRRVPGIHKDISRSKEPSCNTGEKFDEVNQRGGDIQQIVAEAFLQQGKQYFNADISFQNGGGVRVDLPQGSISVAKIYEVLPFTNTLVRLDMTGAEIKATLEDAIDAIVNSPGTTTGSYPYTGGLRWEVDLNQTKGNRISNLDVRSTNQQYVALNHDQIYRVITIDFLANGQDYYTTMKTIPSDRRSDVGFVYAEAFLKYVQSLPENDKGEKLLKKLPSNFYSTKKFTDNQ